MTDEAKSGAVRRAHGPGALRIAVLISGGGSTLANLVQRVKDGRLRGVEIVRVVSSRASVRGVEIASAAGLPVDVVRPRDFASLDAFGAAMNAILDLCGAEVVVLGGYLTLLPVPPSLKRRILNVHPALLPAFGGRGMYGHHVHEAVIRSGAAESGCTVHLVDGEYDHGPIIAQARTPVLPDDTPDTLAERVVSLERELYPAVLQDIADAGAGWLDRPELWPFARVAHSGARASDARPLRPAATQTESRSVGGARSLREAEGAASREPEARGAPSNAYDCRICGRRVEYTGRLPALHPFCSSRCRWVDLGRWFRGQYSIDSDLPPDELPDEHIDA